MVIDLRNTKLSDQIKKVNEIIESSFKETSIITNEETIIKMIPMQILNKKIKCKMKFTDNSWRVNLVAKDCLLYTSPSPRDVEESRMPSSA